MKLLFTVLFSIILGINTFAQDIISVTYEGYVKSEPYRERYKNNPQKLAEMEREFEAASKIPSIHNLTMNKDEASFVLEERIQNEQPSEGLSVKVRFTASNDIYTNLKEEFVLGEHQLGNKTYAIKEPLKAIDWKITSEKKKILGLEVRKATAVYDSVTKVEAWYAPKISYKTGPSDYWGLPGLILEINATTTYENGVNVEVRYIATQIDANPKSAKIKKFEKHQQITQEEYDTMLDEMQKAYQEMHSEGIGKD